MIAGIEEAFPTIRTTARRHEQPIRTRRQRPTPTAGRPHDGGTSPRRATCFSQTPPTLRLDRPRVRPTHRLCASTDKHRQSPCEPFPCRRCRRWSPAEAAPSLPAFDHDVSSGSCWAQRIASASVGRCRPSPRHAHTVSARRPVCQRNLAEPARRRTCGSGCAFPRQAVSVTTARHPGACSGRHRCEQGMPRRHHAGAR
jgi:hypothetical protein